MRLLLATTNRGKLDEIRALLEGLPVEPLTLDEVGVTDPAVELGATFAENARLKAADYARRTGLLAVAEDSGLEIDALGGAPGVRSARFGGPDCPYQERFRLIAEQLQCAGAPGSTARFTCALALADPTGIVFEARGTVEGRIAPEPRGEGGFGYDPIFFYPPFGCTLAEAGDRKSSVSHRGQAFRQLRAFLEHWPGLRGP